MRLVVANETAAVQLPCGTELEAIDFQCHVMPLLARLGCNTANCHGSFQGRGDFRLTLFGRAADRDLKSILERTNLETPADSLLLRKPTEQDEHGGGKRFEVGSWEYQLLSAWIQQGAKPSHPTNNHRLSGVDVTPVYIQFDAPGATATLTAKATFKDSSSECVTSLCRFESRDTAIAEVTPNGQVKSLRPGATHIVISYAGEFAVVPVTVPYAIAEQTPARTDVSDTDSPKLEAGLIDAAINQQLEQLRIIPTEQSSDTQFLRRVTLDTVGRLPTTDEIRNFVESRDAEKRSIVIDRLLADPQHASLWATRLCDLTGCRLEAIEGPDSLKPMRAQMWHEWFRARFAADTPWDEIVRGVVGGTSRGSETVEVFLDREAEQVRAAERGEIDEYAKRPSLDLFYRRPLTDGIYPREALAERVAAAFLGVRIQCARCHTHPSDLWTQGDYAAFVNIFATVTFGNSNELNREILGRLAKQRAKRERGETFQPLPRIQEVYEDLQLTHALRDPETKTIAAPRPLGGAVIDLSPDARARFVEWMTSSENRQFARNWVNRIWAQYFGRGLVEPVDGFSASNPSTHPALLDQLADEFIASKFDMRRIEKQILNSQAYQRSSKPVPSVELADRYYASAPVRLLMAEAVVQITDQTLRLPKRWSGDLPGGRTMFDLGSNRPTDSRLSYLLELFGRGTRESVCDCDRTREPSLRQALHLMSDAKWVEEINKSPLIDELVALQDQRQAIHTAVLGTWSRIPSVSEEELLGAHLHAASDLRTGWGDIIWVLVNSREFRTNH